MSTEDRKATRAVLTRERIVEAAASLVEEDGPDALTMRAVADRLGAGAMSLYRHVSGREELLDLVLARMASDVELHALTGDWRADLAQTARDVRAALVRRPHLTVLLTSRAGLGGGGLALLDRTLGLLHAAGLSPAEAALVNHVLGNYVAGAALWEAAGLAGASGQEREDRRAAAAAALAAIPPAAYPGLAWAGAALTEASVDERFEFGLVLLIDGISRLRGG